MNNTQSYDRPATGPLIPLWLVWAAALAFVFIGLGSFAILDNNEGLYAEIPREMLASHDWRIWVIPHLNGLPYMEKPPLLYWLTALSFFLFGESEWSARLVPALASLACVALLLRFGSVVQRQRAGRLAALMFVTGTGVMAMSRVLMFDMLLTALLAWALFQAYRYITDGKRHHLRLSYALLALALLAKGLVALVLFAFVILAWTAWNAQTPAVFARNIAKWFEPGALLVFFAIALPWHIVASMVEPVFAWFYFINEHVLRFLGRREPHDYYAGAWWYYLPRMIIYLFPWSLFVLALAARRRAVASPADALARRFLWSAWLMPLLFFTVSSAKANYYLVVVMPFAAMHLALAIEERDWLPRWGRALPGAVIALIAIAGMIALALRRGHPADSGITVWNLGQHGFVLLVLAVTALLAIIAAAAAAFRQKIGVTAYLIVPAWLAIVLGSTLHAMEATVSTRPLATFLQEQIPGRKVYLYWNFEEQSSLPFYLKHPLPVVDPHSNDLFWGNRLRKNRLMISDEQFNRETRGQPVALVVMDRQLGNFMQSGLAADFTQRRHIGNSNVFYR